MAGEFEVQKALYLALDGIGLTTYDAAPQATDGGSLASYPYVEVGAIVLAEWDTSSETGVDYIARIHTRANGPYPTNWCGNPRKPYPETRPPRRLFSAETRPQSQNRQRRSRAWLCR